MERMMLEQTINRYSRQIIFPEIGRRGQEKLGKSFAVVVGCGALGTVVASTLVRAGVGRIRIIDRDFIEYHNLQRQVLFDEDDIRDQLPKAVAAERHLKKVNSSIQIEGVVADVNFTNIEKLIEGADVILDGLDNTETRYLINDVALKNNIPWIYGGVIASSGMTMTILPHETPCLRCIQPVPNDSGRILTCDTAGVIGPAPLIVGGLQAVEAMKILVGSNDINRHLTVIDVWTGTFNSMPVNVRESCPACHGEYEFLKGKKGLGITRLCGQNAVQVLNTDVKHLSFDELRERLEPVGEVTGNEFMLHFSVDSNDMVVFPDGRVIVKNTYDESLAKGLYAKYIGA
jgi:molybdopterin/thiamine biosynthesis adenylyltransferase